MQNKVNSYRDLQVWQKARLLVKDIYLITKSFPKEELYGLTSQIRRACISVPSNLAEGSSKGSTKEFLRFISIAYGSLAEIETQLYLACDLEYICSNNLDALIEKTSEIGRMLNGLDRSLNQRLNPTELRTPNSGLLQDA